MSLNGSSESAKGAPTVLCVDDEGVGLEVRRILLEREGFQVLTAADGPEGIELFNSCEVSAVVLDYSMPGMDGGQVAAVMRQSKPSVPILLLSAYVDLPPNVLENVDLYITKGGGPATLLKNLRTILHRNS